jgi:tetratricopeptide (TPR) repeat protein
MDVDRNVTATFADVPPPPPPPPPQPEPQPPPAPPPPSEASGSQLNLQGFQLQQQGRYDEALPLLQQAVAKLQGTYTPSFRDEAYANYNLGFTLLQLGRCEDAGPYLDRSEALQGSRAEIEEAQAAVAECLGGGGEGKGKGKKNEDED